MEIHQTEAKIAQILNTNEKVRLGRELRETKRAVRFCGLTVQ